MNKQIYLYIILFFSFSAVDAQAIDRDVYQEAFSEVCSSLWSFFPRGELFVEQNYLTTKALKTSSCGSLHLIGEKFIRKNARKKNKDFYFIRIVPLRIEEGSVFVTVLVFKADRKGKQLHLSNVYGEKIKFNYSCDNESFNLKEIRLDR